MPSWSQIEAQVRGLLMLVAGYAVGRGIISEGDAVTIVGALLAVISAGWSIWVNRKSALVQAVERIPEVRAVTVDRSETGRDINVSTGAKVSVETSR